MPANHILILILLLFFILTVHHQCTEVRAAHDLHLISQDPEGIILPSIYSTLQQPIHSTSMKTELNDNDSMDCWKSNMLDVIMHLESRASAGQEDVSLDSVLVQTWSAVKRLSHNQYGNSNLSATLLVAQQPGISLLSIHFAPQERFKIHDSHFLS